jgi:nicotinamidase-related amidase
MDGKTANTSPHKGLSCLSNDLIKQLRMRHVEKVIMAGPVGNICLENHMRDLIEAGFEIAMPLLPVGTKREVPIQPQW